MPFLWVSSGSKALIILSPQSQKCDSSPCNKGRDCSAGGNDKNAHFLVVTLFALLHPEYNFTFLPFTFTVL